MQQTLDKLKNGGGRDADICQQQSPVIPRNLKQSVVYSSNQQPPDDGPPNKIKINYNKITPTVLEQALKGNQLVESKVEAYGMSLAESHPFKFGGTNSPQKKKKSQNSDSPQKETSSTPGKQPGKIFQQANSVGISST
jgi:hypothetical protein